MGSNDNQKLYVWKYKNAQRCFLMGIFCRMLYEQINLVLLDIFVNSELHVYCGGG